jgi:hypothetical protein
LAQHPIEHLQEHLLPGLRQAAQALDLLLQLRGGAALAGAGGLTEELLGGRQRADLPAAANSVAGRIRPSQNRTLTAQACTAETRF